MIHLFARARLRRTRRIAPHNNMSRTTFILLTCTTILIVALDITKTQQGTSSLLQLLRVADAFTLKHPTILKKRTREMWGHANDVFVSRKAGIRRDSGNMLHGRQNIVTFDNGGGVSPFFVYRNSVSVCLACTAGTSASSSFDDNVDEKDEDASQFHNNNNNNPSNNNKIKDNIDKLEDLSEINDHQDTSKDRSHPGSSRSGRTHHDSITSSSWNNKTDLHLNSSNDIVEKMEEQGMTSSPFFSSTISVMDEGSNQDSSSSSGSSSIYGDHISSNSSTSNTTSSSSGDPPFRTNQFRPKDDKNNVSTMPVHKSVQTQAGPLWNSLDQTTQCLPHRGRSRKRVLVLCTGGTLTMSNDPTQGNSLAPVQGALTEYMATMRELTDDPEMPEIVAHEYTPLLDSSDMGPGDWAVVAQDIATNYYHFDGFVVLQGTDTMAYAASALSFMFQNLGKPVVFTGSQIPLREPYNDARKNLIMAIIFASSDTVSEVTIFFHDRLLRACRATKINTSRLLAFDSPNMDPLAVIGINIEEKEHLFLPPPRGAFRLRTEMDTRLVTLRLVPGFDDTMIIQMIRAAQGTHLRGLILQLYGTGNMPSLKDDLIQCFQEANQAGVCVVVTTQCLTGSVLLGHYATGQALKKAGVISAGDMTLEATTAKLAYLLGRQDLTMDEVKDLMGVDLRGELTPQEKIPPPPLASAYQKAIAKKNRSRIF